MFKRVLKKSLAISLAFIMAFGVNISLPSKEKKVDAASSIISLSDEDIEEIYENSLENPNYSRVEVHDPSIVLASDSGNYGSSEHKYYIFGSHMAWAYSDDLKNWTRFENNINSNYATIFKKEFEWAAKGDSNYDPSGNLWAPDIIWNKKLKKWCMYMSLNGNSWNSSIAMLTADSLDGDWSYEGTVVYSGFAKTGVHDYTLTDYKTVTGDTDLDGRYISNDTTWNFRYGAHAIDPCVYYDQEGNLRFVYGSWSGGIYTFELDENTGFRDNDVKYTYVSGKSDPYMGIKLGGSTSSGEAAYIQYINDRYYLFLSYGGLEANGGYNMRVFSSESPEGPFVDVAGKQALSGGGVNGNIGNRLMSYYKWSFMDSGFVAQGHNSAFTDTDGKSYVIYHTRFSNKGEMHQVRVHQIFQAKNGGLVTAPFEYSGETLSEEAYSKSKVVGEYKIISMKNTDNVNLVCNEEKDLLLNDDGSVTGDYTGTWKQDVDSPNLTITTSDATYQGVFLEQNIEETKNKTMCLTLVGNNDLSIWGYKKSSDDLILAQAVKSLNVTIPDEIYTDLKLPQETSNDAQINWYSSDYDIIDSDGKFTQPDETTDVTLTMVITKGNYEYEKKYIVKAISKAEAVSDIESGLKSHYEFEGDLKNSADEQGEPVGTAKALEKGTAPTFEENADKGSKVLHQYFGYADANTTSYTEFTNPLKGQNLEGATISLWVNKLEADPWDAIWGFMGDKGRFYLTPNTYLGFNANNENWADLNHPNSVTVNDIAQNAWSLVTVTVSSDNAKIYIDGILKYEMKDASAKGANVNNQAMLDIISDSSNFYLGYGSWWGSAPLLLDDLRIYDRELSKVDVASLYNKERYNNVSEEVKSLDGSGYYYYDDYNEATSLTDWNSTNAYGNLRLDVDENNEYAKYVHYAFTSAIGGERTAYLNMPHDDTSDIYFVDFDMKFKSNNDGNRTGQVALATEDYTKNNSLLTSGYIWSMTSSGASTTWTDNNSEQIVMDYNEWVHVSTKIDKTQNTATLTISGPGVESTVTKTYENLTQTDIKGLFIRGGRNYSDTKIDNVRVYSYDLKFDANGGSGTMPNQGFAAGKSGNLNKNTFTHPDDYLFLGWSESADGDVVYSDKDEITEDIAEAGSTKTLYAIWGNVENPQDTIDQIETKTYTKDLTLSDYELPASWEWENPDQHLSAGTNNYIAISGDYKYEISIKVLKGTMSEEEISLISRPSGLIGNEGDKLRWIELPENWSWKDGSILLSANETTYKALYKTDNYKAVELDLEVTSVPSFENLKYQENFKLSDLDLPEGWAWKDETIGLKVGNNTAILINDQTEYTITISVIKGDYNLEDESIPTDLKGVEGDELSTVTLPENWKWKSPSAVLSSKTKTYTAVYTEPSGNYNSNEVNIPIEVIEIPSFEKVYEEGLILKDISFENSEWTWKDSSIKLENVGESNYTALYDEREYEISVTLKKATFTEEEVGKIQRPEALTGTEGDELSTIKLPDNWKWKAETEKLSLSKKLYTAIYTEPSGNFEDVDLDLEVTVNKKEEAVTKEDTKTIDSQETATKETTTDKETATDKETSSATKTLAVGTTKNLGKFKYKVLSKTSVSIQGFKKSSYKKSVKTVTIPKTVKLQGKTYKVTKIANNAFAKCKKLKKLTIGTNVTTIGKKAFFKSQKLSKIVFKTKKLKKVGKNALKGVAKKVTIKVPASVKKKYKKLLKNKGQKSTARIS